MAFAKFTCFSTRLYLEESSISPEIVKPLTKSNISVHCALCNMQYYAFGVQFDLYSLQLAVGCVEW